MFPPHQQAGPPKRDFAENIYEELGGSSFATSDHLYTRRIIVLPLRDISNFIVTVSFSF
jgi:hypothetical protein